ncbi:hypothetical protein Tco_1389156, partial [Tanacetum coccineum]
LQLDFDVLSPVNKSPTRKNQGKKGMSSSRRHAKMRKTGEEGQEEEQDDGEGEAKRKPHVPRHDVVNFYLIEV